MRIARPILGLLLVAMGVGQLVDFGQFIDVIETYRLGSGWLATLLGGALLTAELIGGIGLLARRDFAPPVALAVAVAWTVIGTQAFARGLVVPNCGCFGIHLSQPLRWWVLVQDVEFVAVAWWVHRRWNDTPTADLDLGSSDVAEPPSEGGTHERVSP